MTRTFICVEPTDEDVAAIVAVLFQDDVEAEATVGPVQSRWLVASRAEAVDRWVQSSRLSRPLDKKD